jgi:hypothetical protein
VAKLVIAAVRNSSTSIPSSCSLWGRNSIIQSPSCVVIYYTFLRMRQLMAPTNCFSAPLLDSLARIFGNCDAVNFDRQIALSYSDPCLARYVVFTLWMISRTLCHVFKFLRENYEIMLALLPLPALYGYWSLVPFNVVISFFIFRSWLCSLCLWMKDVKWKDNEVKLYPYLFSSCLRGLIRKFKSVEHNFYFINKLA